MNLSNFYSLKKEQSININILISEHKNFQRIGLSKASSLKQDYLSDIFLMKII